MARVSGTPQRLAEALVLGALTATLFVTSPAVAGTTGNQAASVEAVSPLATAGYLAPADTQSAYTLPTWSQGSRLTVATVGAYDLSGAPVVPTVPGKPTGVTATAGNASAFVSWTAPADDGGSPISLYLVETIGIDLRTCSPAPGATSCTVVSLTNSQSYTFVVVAYNSVGSGPPSDPSAPVTPLDPRGSTYHALTPARILDSRYGIGFSGTIGTYGGRPFQVTGQGGVPTGATAVTGNLTVTGQTSKGYLYLGPIAISSPTSSTLNFPVGDDRANAVTVPLSNSGMLAVAYISPDILARTHVIFDVTGFFTPDATGATYHALTPARILDSRYGTGLSGTFSSHVARTFTVIGRGGVPTNATAITGNLTVTQQTSLGFIFVGPVALNDPTSSTLNFPLGDDRANAVTVTLGTGGTLSATYAAPTYGPTAHVIFDVTGYFTAAGG